ncbi:hypothetical protein [Burkholderia glumae]|uniref:hypothetical protein n=1 Tax=Burkholderia glumae TaxID=337 RepID=UPI00214A15F5|nr:hypothetical protein [Burkholderia glumae]MCR1767724.1 hypothetical protein [Burkholderia glumae]
MSWAELHAQSEVLASEAFIALRQENASTAEALYAKAAELEEAALYVIESGKPRTLGITAVSAVSLWFKARVYRRAEQLACLMLGNKSLPEFAADNLRLLIQAIWTEQSKLQAGVAFLPGQVMVSVKGGEVVTGGAPLDLIVDKVQTVQSIFYRTIEFLKNMPHRSRGGPQRSIQDACRPWLFQAPPGSYQFSVAIQEPAQKDFFDESIKPDEVALHFLALLKASSLDEREALERLIPDREYRSTFLKLIRNLAPTGKSFERLEIKAAGESGGVVLAPENRVLINQSLREQTPPISSRGEATTVVGTLRAVHLDKDWLDLNMSGKSIHIDGVKDSIDDIIGPMMNKQVVVHVLKLPKGKLKFVDIELEE